MISLENTQVCDPQKVIYNWELKLSENWRKTGFYKQQEYKFKYSSGAVGQTPP